MLACCVVVQSRGLFTPESEVSVFALFFSVILLILSAFLFFFFFSSRRRHTRCLSDWSSDVCSSDLPASSRARDWAAALPPSCESAARESSTRPQGTGESPRRAPRQAWCRSRARDRKSVV